MGIKVNAVCNTGPIIHLREIGAEKALSVFSIIVPPAVKEEVKRLPEKITIVNDFDNDFAAFLQNQFALGLAESQCIALCKTKKIPLFLTDDLDARTTAKELGFDPHGTIGVLLKAFRHKIFSKKQTVEFVKKLKSSKLYAAMPIFKLRTTTLLSPLLILMAMLSAGLLLAVAGLKARKKPLPMRRVSWSKI